MARKFQLQKANNEVVDKSIEVLESLLDDCPTPTDAELRRLLGMQAAILNNLGVQLFVTSKDMKRIDGRLRLVIKAFEASRAATEAAARIKVPDSDLNSDSESDSKSILDSLANTGDSEDISG